MRVPEQQPHHSLDVQGASHPSSHSFTTHVVFNTYSPLHYDGDGGDIPFYPIKEGDETQTQYDGNVQDIHFYPPNEVNQPQMQTNEDSGMDVEEGLKSCGNLDTTIIYKRRLGRMVKPSAILKFLFVDNCQKQFKRLTRKERLLANYVFANGRDEEYVQFS